MAPATKVERTSRPRSPLRAPTPLAVSHNGTNGSAKHDAKNGRLDSNMTSGRKHDSLASYESNGNHEDAENIDDYEKRKGPEKRSRRGYEGEPRPSSLSERTLHPSRAPTPLLVKGDHILRDIDRAPPGDPSQLRVRRTSGLASAAGDRGGGSDDVARQRSQYFEDVFSARDSNSSPAKERVRSEALVLAELRTNVMIGDEFTVITELSASLAVRYRRPLSSVVVTLQHNSCMCFGGSFDPAYVLSIFALPAELQPTTNKRNAALIQRHMEEALGVPPARGLLRFAPVTEANLAYGGKTTAGYIDDLPKNTGAGTTTASNYSCRSPVLSTTADMHDLGGSTRKRRASRKLSVKSLSNFRSPSPPSPTPVGSTAEDQQQQQQPDSLSSAYLPSIVERSPKESPQYRQRTEREKERREHKGPSGADQDTGLEMLPETSPSATWQPSRRAKRTKSFVATLFGRSAIKYEMGTS
ncbi:mif domain containing protein [Grosmannia clavigera kw1407]|uniref:L-dopachrome isomerase n=1 Tax=Grosmannia clavigera (strain kw1407 / UAMH 11150) TaxID=655863 RepID=F0XF94_GROCL|nr:mif domain containing protein [Grosmannia clavigera kw1407]EFX04428.1 mif domain containing protein [Grosmannia clavigera kw1407]